MNLNIIHHLKKNYQNTINTVFKSIRRDDFRSKLTVAGCCVIGRDNETNKYLGLFLSGEQQQRDIGG